jgi:hypothetical protein
MTDMALIRQVKQETQNDESKQTSEKPWWMPTTLIKDELDTIARASKDDSTHAARWAPNHKPPVARFISRGLAFECVLAMNQRSKEKIKPSRYVPQEWRIGRKKLSPDDFKKVVWRPDMLAFVLKYMRQKVVKALEEAYRYGKIKKTSEIQLHALQLSEMSVTGLLEGLRSVEMPDMRSGAVVILGDSASDSGSETVNPLLSQFPDYITVPQTKSAVPVFDLSTLLTSSDREALRAYIPQFSEKALFFFPDGPKSVDAMLAMWELKGMFMHDTDFLADQTGSKSPENQKDDSS